MTKNIPPIGQIVAEELNEYIKIQETLKENVTRLQRLIRVQLLLQKELAVHLSAEELLLYLEDVHRAVVVFAHSMLETTLTELIRIRLKTRFDRFSETIPVLGSRSDKLTLKELWKHRGKTVDELINQSIDEFMNQKSFNRLEDITRPLGEIGVQVDSLKSYSGALSDMMRRRHQIVHESDYLRNSLQNQLAKVDFADVSKWAGTVREFCATVMKEVVLSQSLAEDLQKRAEACGVHVSITEVQASIRSMLNSPKQT